MRQHARYLFIALLPLLAGCSTLRATMDGWGQGRDGLSRSQRELREALSGGDFTKALAWSDDDELLRAVTRGISTYYAGQFARSAALMDTAALLADTRLTTSVSKTGLSLVTNDMARPYALRRTERLFVPWYGMLSYARLGEWEDAAVEARRMLALLEQDRTDRDEHERALHAAMYHLAAAVLERAGERDAGSVAYRNAHALADGFPVRPVAPAGDSGEVLVVVERGFVAHRATETIHVTLDGDDDGRDADEARRRASDRVGSRVPMPASVGQATVVTAARRDGWGGHNRHHDDGDDDDDDRHIALAFPSLRRSARPWAGAPAFLLDSATAEVPPAYRLSANVDDASEVDERRERAAMIAREMARATAKYAVTKAVRDKQGEVAGTLADMGAALLERADVRSWHLLPQEVVLMRVRVPAGTHAMAVTVGEGANARRVALGPVSVRPGALTLAPARIWNEPAFHGRAGCLSRSQEHCER